MRHSSMVHAVTRTCTALLNQSFSVDCVCVCVRSYTVLLSANHFLLNFAKYVWFYFDSAPRCITKQCRVADVLLTLDLEHDSLAEVIISSTFFILKGSLFHANYKEIKIENHALV